MTKKIIPFEINLKSSQRAGFTFQPRPQILTNDANSAELNFIITDANSGELTGATATVLLFMKDGSFFQNTDVTRVNNTFVYTIKPNQAKHKGVAQAQLVIKIGSVENASPLMEFEIIGGLETKPIVERDIQDWTSLTAEAKAFVDQIEGFTLESFVENKMGQELANLEVNYAGRLTGLESADQSITAQLAEKANEFEVVKKGRGTLSDFDEPTRATLLGLEPGEINAVLGKGNVTPENTSFMNVKRINLLDTAKMVPGTVAEDGTLENTSSGHKTSDFTEVEEGRYYSSSGVYHSGYYDANKVFVQTLRSYTRPFVIPTGLGIKYVRMAFGQTQLNEPMFVEGTKLPTTFIPYSEYYIDIPENEFKESLLTVFDEKLSNSPLNPNQTTFLKETKINLVDSSKLVDGYISQSTGEVVSGTLSKTSPFIEVAEGEMYTTNSTWDSGMYDSNKIFVTGLTQHDSTILIPPGVKYVRMAFYNIAVTSGAMFNIGTALSPYVAYDDTLNRKISFKDDVSRTTFVQDIKPLLGSELEGLKWNVLGDSITAPSNAYHSVIKQKHSMIVNNYGISGTRIAVQEGFTNAMVERYINMTDDADIITVFGGTNDHGGVPLGDISSTDTSTFYGALNVLCAGLIQKYPGKRIGFFTPMQRSNLNYALMSSYADAIKEVCGKYSIPVLDLLNGGGLHPDNETIKTMYIPDGLHPNEEGHKVIARRIEAFIKSL